MDDAYKRARKKVKKKKKFFKELGVFVSLTIGLMILNLATNPNNLWFYWAIGPWGLVLLSRGISMAISERSGDWEEREMRKQLLSMGKDPDDYIEDRLELNDLEPEYSKQNRDYQDEDLV